MKHLYSRITSDKKVPKKWGEEVWLFNDEKTNLCSKLLIVNKNKGFNYHFHLIKEEHFRLCSGKVKYFEINPENASIDSIILNEGDGIFINRGTVHSVLALEDSVIFETSTFHRDEDSYRTHKNAEIQA